MTSSQTGVLLGLTAALANVIGGLILSRTHWARFSVRYFLALGSGFMLGTAILEMLPASMQLLGDATMAWVLGGYLLMHFFEHSIHGHFHFGEEVHCDELMSSRVGFSIVGGLAIHSFFDGIAIASGLLVSTRLGALVFLAILLHKIPEGFTAASVMLASRCSGRAAFWASATLGLATVAGTLVMAIFQAGISYALALSAGVTIYVAATDLIPEVNREPGIAMAFVVFAGVALLVVVRFLLH